MTKSTAGMDVSVNEEQHASVSAREARLRRTARRRGLQLLKSRRRDMQAIDFGGFMLVDDRNCVVMGSSPFEFCATLDDIEDWLLPSSV